jgi:hypothetical protein
MSLMFPMLFLNELARAIAKLVYPQTPTTATAYLVIVPCPM